MRPREQVVEIPVEEIRPNPYQPRQSMDDTALHELAESIREHGVLQPVVVRRAGAAYELIAGERRYRASQLAGLTRVPACVRNYSDQQALELALVENLQREDINPMEAARAYRRLADEFLLTQEEIATKVGKSRSAISNALRLLQLPPKVQRSLEMGEITEGHARALLSAEPGQREPLLDQLRQQRTTVREVEQQAKAAAPDREVNSPRVRKPQTADANLGAIEAQLRQRLGTKVQIQRKGSRGSINIEFYSEEDLERVVAALGVSV
jgi:ParB family chromosome partitioning protein